MLLLIIAPFADAGMMLFDGCFQPEQLSLLEFLLLLETMQPGLNFAGGFGGLGNFRASVIQLSFGDALVSFGLFELVP
jgi:hypothetical protein